MTTARVIAAVTGSCPIKVPTSGWAAKIARRRSGGGRGKTVGMNQLCALVSIRPAGPRSAASILMRYRPFSMSAGKTLCRETFLIDAMNLIDSRTGEFDWPPHAEIVLQNPAEFDVLKRTRFAAMAHFLDECQNDRPARRLAVQGTADAEQGEPSRHEGVVSDP